MNPFDELQQPQQPLGAMLATPQAAPPAQQQVAGMGPPASPEDYARRTQGWSGALNELLASPELAVMLMQAGMAMSSGRGAMESFGEGIGAVGRFGAAQESQRGRDLLNQRADERLGFERQEARQQAELHPLAMQYRQMQMDQIKQQMARGRGGGGGSTPDVKLEKEKQMFFSRADAAGLSGPEAESAWQAYNKSKIGLKEPTPEMSLKDRVMEARKGDPTSEEYIWATEQLMGRGSSAPAPGTGGTVPKTSEQQAESRMWGIMDNVFSGGKGKPQSKPQAKDAGAAVAGKMALTPGNMTSWFGTGDRPDVGPPAPNALDMAQRRIDEFLQIFKENSIFRNW